MKNDVILILDFGGQYCHLIARRVRELHVYSEIVPCDISPKEIENLNKKVNVKGLILSGSPYSIYSPEAPRIDRRILDLGIPILGLCYGHQLLAWIFGGEVSSSRSREYGITYVTIDKPVAILKGLSERERVWMSHGDTVVKVPEALEVLAHTSSSPVAAFKHRRKPIYGVQWHPEVTHTERGMDILKNFVEDICGCSKGWRPENLIEQYIKEVKEKVKDGKAVMALSGGIDSGMAAILASKAIGENLTAIFVDHGFMREGEPQTVKRIFGELGVRVTVIDAKDRFFSSLKGVADPEEKRKIIGREFIKVFEEQARKVGAEYLIQGTIYPDRIESGFRRHSDKIKSHHNVAGLPTNIRFKAIIESLRDLYKDEVREIAKKLNMPEELIYRQPFPGPGLAVRVVGEVTPEKVSIVRKATKIVEEVIEKSGLNRSLWQYFAVLTDTKTTGVKGDARVYGLTVAVRIVESREAMTASFAKIPYEVLEEISTRITNEIPQVSRVVYDITHKPPATIEWE
ncbi:glutamine-hydrolyzing GMP synthase [Candidatus Bathyarchaeota archaeon]|nr:glutamine-hydrolyzing GMP synthase [Candidatus Bathyarchaeota archaeon]